MWFQMHSLFIWINTLNADNMFCAVYVNQFIKFISSQALKQNVFVTHIVINILL